MRHARAIALTAVLALGTVGAGVWAGVAAGQGAAQSRQTAENKLPKSADCDGRFSLDGSISVRCGSPYRYRCSGRWFLGFLGGTIKVQCRKLD